MAQQADRIFKELFLIKKLIHIDIEHYCATGDEAIDCTVRQMLHRQVRRQADDFLMTLYAIAHEMDFSDWQDFWLDMGIRIFCDDSDDPFSIDLYDYCND